MNSTCKLTDLGKYWMLFSRLTKLGYKKVKYCDGIAWAKNVKPNADPQEAFAIVRDLESRMPDWAKTAWRWRLVALRAEIDAERFAHDLDITERSADCFEEIKTLYHADDHGEKWLFPPTRKWILRGSTK